MITATDRSGFPVAAVELPQSLPLLRTAPAGAGLVFVMLKPSVEVREQDGLLLAEFWDCHRLDPNPVLELRSLFEAHVQRGGKPVVVIDMRGVGYAGSSALGGFVSLRRKGARVIFHQVEPNVVEVFRVSQLLPLFGFADTAEAALDLAHKGTATAEPPRSGDDATAAPAAPRIGSAPPLRRGRSRPDPTG